MNGLKKNVWYQTLYQILTTCFPLITSPYLARSLGAEKQGIFSYTASIVNWFMLIALLGVTDYGTREIATCGKNKKKRSVAFWGIYAIQFLSTLLMVVAYVCYLLFFCKENLLIAALQSFYLLSAGTDINWLFFGVERFDITVKRNIVIKITQVVLILTLVKTTDDLWIYTLLMAGGMFLTNFVLWAWVGKVIDFGDICNLSRQNIIGHIRPIFVFFVPLLGMSVYHIMDKTMLGVLSNYTQVGYYYNADKIINIPLGIITGFGTVMLPRATAVINSDEHDKSDGLFQTSLELVVCAASAMTFGVSAISKEFTPWFFGSEFEPCIWLIIVLSPVFLVKGLSHQTRMQYLIPNKKESIFIEAVFIGAAVNLVLNYLLITRYGAMGAVVGTLAAEAVSCIWQFARVRKELRLGRTMMKFLYYLCAGAVMCTGVRWIAGFLSDGIWGIAAEVLVGAAVYIILCFVFWRITKRDKDILKR